MIFTARQREALESVVAFFMSEEVDADYAQAHAATTPEALSALFDKLKPKQTVWMSWTNYGSGSGDTRTFSPYTVNRRSFSKKYNVSSVSLLRPGQKSANSLVKLTLMKRSDGDVSLAIGDMATKLHGIYLP